jgi:hypothetical protein
LGGAATLAGARLDAVACKPLRVPTVAALLAGVRVGFGVGVRVRVRVRARARARARARG